MRLDAIQCTLSNEAKSYRI